MAEVKDPAEKEGEMPTPREAPSASGEAAPALVQQVERPRRPPMSRKKKKRIIRWSVAGVVILAVALVLVKVLGGKSGAESTVVTDVAQYGSITSTVQGSGLTKGKDTESIAIATAGTVQEVYVTEGQQVTAGTPLFVIDSEAARTAVENAQKDVEGYQKQLKTLNENLAGLNLAPSYSGKLMDTVELNPGDEISAGTVVAKLVDDNTMKLKQYYSYAYQGEIKTGQAASVSVPTLMSTVSGTVSGVHMVSRISPEGSKLFEVEIRVPNPGSLTADMVASAVLSASGESIYPYESGKLEYSRTSDLKTTVGGKILSSSLLDYMSVQQGQVLVQIDGEDSQNEQFDLEKNLEEAQTTLDTAQTNLDNCSAVAPIDGTVMGLAIATGDEVAANTSVITIADTSTILIDATVDERNVSYVKAGMMVNIDQWGTTFNGTVESVSLNSQAENGVASYPMVISVDNSGGTMMTGSYVNYSLVASQNDNCLVLPIQCVKSVPLDDGSTGSVVFVKADTKPDDAIDLSVPVDGIPDGFWPVVVETGISDDYNVEIKSGVAEGTEVFTAVQTQNSWGY